MSATVLRWLLAVLALATGALTALVAVGGLIGLAREDSGNALDWIRATVGVALAAWLLASGRALLQRTRHELAARLRAAARRHVTLGPRARP